MRHRVLAIAGLLIAALFLAAGIGILLQGRRLADRGQWKAYDGFIGTSGRMSTQGNDTVKVFWKDDRGADHHGDMFVTPETQQRLLFGTGPKTTTQKVFVYQRWIGHPVACAEEVFAECAGRTALHWSFALGAFALGAALAWYNLRTLRRP